MHSSLEKKSYFQQTHPPLNIQTQPHRITSNFLIIHRSISIEKFVVFDLRLLTWRQGNWALDLAKICTNFNGFHQFLCCVSSFTVRNLIHARVLLTHDDVSCRSRWCVFTNVLRKVSQEKYGK